MAIAFAKKGANVIINYHSSDIEAEIVKEVIESYNVKCLTIKADISKSNEVKNMVKTIIDEFGRIDILVNNAGFGLVGNFEDLELDRELDMIDTNIRALHILTKLYLKDMLKKNKGKILNVASIAGFLPGPLMSTYYATKNYVVTFSESIREELRRKKSSVKISILCPGPVDTNFDRVANVDFSLNSLSSDYVADYAIDKLMKNKFYIIPGIKIKLLRVCSKFLPNCILSRFVYLSQKRKKSV